MLFCKISLPFLWLFLPLTWLALGGQLIQSANAQLMSLNQPGGSPCTDNMWIYGSILNAAGDAIPACQAPFTSGSVLFMGSSSVSQDNAHFFWDSSNLRLGLGTSSPHEQLTSIIAAGGQALFAGSSNFGVMMQDDGGGEALIYATDAAVSGTKNLKIQAGTLNLAATLQINNTATLNTTTAALSKSAGGSCTLTFANGLLTASTC